jgi:hypothetical protein
LIWDLDKLARKKAKDLKTINASIAKEMMGDV